MMEELKHNQRVYLQNKWGTYLPYRVVLSEKHKGHIFLQDVSSKNSNKFLMKFYKDNYCQKFILTEAEMNERLEN